MNAFNTNKWNLLDDVKAVTCAQGNSCQNGATCVDTIPLNTYVCICTPQWTGDLCDYPTGMIIRILKRFFNINFKIPPLMSV